MANLVNLPNPGHTWLSPFWNFVKASLSLVFGNLPMYVVDATSVANIAGTYANGSSGVGATLTKATAGAFPTTDGIPAFYRMLVFLTGQTDPAENGYWRLTTPGDSSTAWVLTRAEEFDASADMVPGTLFSIRTGTTYSGQVWAYTGAASPTVGTTALTFARDYVLRAAAAAVVSGVTQFAQDALQVLNSGGTFATKFRSLATATRTATLPDASGNVMLDASADTVTGLKNFNAGTAKIDNGTSTTNAHLLASAATAARTATLPDGDLTVAGVNLAQTWSALQTFAQDMLKVNNAAATFGTLFRSLATATRTVTLPDADFTPAQAGIVSDATAPGFTGAAATAAVAAAAESGTGLTAAGQVLTSTDNKTATLNQYAGYWLISAEHGPYLIVSNTAVTGAPLVLTVIGGPATTDAGIYQIHAAPTPAGAVASHTHEQN